MRIGCSTITFGPLSADAALERIAALGFGVVDLAAVPRFFEHVQLTGAPVDQGERLATLVRGHGLDVAALQSVPWIPDAIDDPDELRRRYTEAADVAQAVGAAAWIVDANRPAGEGEPGRDRGIERWKRTVQMAAELAAARGLRLGVEAPHRGTLAETLPQVLELLDAADLPDLGVDLDTSHVATCGAPTVDVVDALGDRIVHVALRDVTADGAPCTPGDGTFDFAELFDLLARHGHRGDATLELEPPAAASADERAADARRARDHLAPLADAARPR